MIVYTERICEECEQKFMSDSDGVCDDCLKCYVNESASYCENEGED